MLIKKFVAKNINKKISCDFDFYDDINVVTGRNGSGKTTVLKVIWYLISANIERIPREIEFDVLFLETDRYRISIEKLAPKPNTERKFKFDVTVGDKTHSATLSIAEIEGEAPFVHTINNKVIGAVGGSIFFPTFRRIEGGFSMTPSENFQRTSDARFGREPPDMTSQAVSQLSRRLSLYAHTFVASISTDDIVRLLTTRYASISEVTNRSHKQLSDKIFALLAGYRQAEYDAEMTQLQKARNTLEQIGEEVNRFNNLSDLQLKPFTTLSNLVKEVFRTKGIRVAEQIVLGDVEHCVSSSTLSSGEKQMLSFLCYNAFSNEVPIFIDEPEISLHVDWQRMLFPTLLEQGTSNQFIVATHSPFIYSKYKDKELQLDIDRGDLAHGNTSPDR